MKRKQPVTAAVAEEDFEHKHPVLLLTLVLAGGVAILLFLLLVSRFAIGPSINQRGHEISHSIAATQKFAAETTHPVH